MQKGVGNTTIPTLQRHCANVVVNSSAWHLAYELIGHSYHGAHFQARTATLAHNLLASSIRTIGIVVTNGQDAAWTGRCRYACGVRIYAAHGARKISGPRLDQQLVPNGYGKALSMAWEITALDEPSS